MLGITPALLVGLLALAVPVAAGLGILGLDPVGDLFEAAAVARHGRDRLGRRRTTSCWSRSRSSCCSARSCCAPEWRSACTTRWCCGCPGFPAGLMHSNIAACAMFAATSGSSVATAATIGTVALGEVEKRGYSERLFLGTIAAGGTLGILIPPSINMIVYGVLTETSIPKLYLAGFIPGLVLASLFSLTVLVICLIRPQLGGRPTSTTWERALPGAAGPAAAADHLPRGDRLDLCGLGNRDRVRGARRDRRHRHRRLESPAHPAHAAACLRRHDAHHRHDHGDPARGLFPQLRHHVDRADRPGQPLHHRASGSARSSC